MSDAADTYDYDLFVIGAGSGGVRAARMSASYGARVAVAEEYRVGGTCVIRGCVPKKLFVYAGRFAGEFEDAAGFGWTVDKPEFNWQTLLANKDKEIDRLNQIYIRNLEKAGGEIILSRAVVEDPHHIRLVKEDRVVSARHILVATGGTPFKPDIPGAEFGITSNEAFHLEELPKEIAIIGGGYIAVEFACIFHALGVKTKLVYRGPQVLRGFDDDMRNGLAEEMTRRGIELILNASPAALVKSEGGCELQLDNGDAHHVGAVMFATGRVPNTEGLGLEKAGVELGDNGKVVVDSYSQTSVENIYAVGDVTDRVNLTPVAIREGAAFAETVYNNNPVAVDHGIIPTGVFSDPEIGTVGMTEDEARANYDGIDIYKSRFRAMKHTLSGREEYTIMKLIVDQLSERVLGCHILGPDSAEMVQLIAVSMRMGLKKSDLDATMALHPSAAEELVTMREKWQPE